MLSVTRANFTPDNGSVIYADLAVLVQTCTQGPSFCLRSARSHATLAGQDFSCWGACALCWQIFILGRVSASAAQQQRAPCVHIMQPAATWGFPRRALCLLQPWGANELDPADVLLLVGGLHGLQARTVSTAPKA